MIIEKKKMISSKENKSQQNYVIASSHETCDTNLAIFFVVHFTIMCMPAHFLDFIDS